MDLKNLFQSKTFKGILAGIGIAIVALLIFQAGMFVGYHKAAFSFGWGDNYYRNFGGPRGEFMPDLPRGDYPNAHGAAGKIIKINLPTVIVEDLEKIEKVVLLKDETKIQQFRNEVKSTDLKLNDFITVIGSPNDQGQIEATFVRIMPPLPDQGNSP